MTGDSPANSGLGGRQVIRSVIAAQWLVLFAIAMVNSVLDWRSTEATRVLEKGWAFALVFLTAFVLSPRRRLAAQCFYYVASTFTLLELGSCFLASGRDMGAIAFLLYLVGVLVASTWQFHTDGVLFGFDDRGVDI